jgi:hypothetical protein
MEIALIIVGGLTLISMGGMVFAYLEKRLSLQAPADSEAVARLSSQVAALETRLAEQDSKMHQLEESARFTAKLLEKVDS